jgi:hypothetical protein
MKELIFGKPRLSKPCVCSWAEAGGDGGIRTLDTLFEYNALARRRLQPLGHVSGERTA